MKYDDFLPFSYYDFKKYGDQDRVPKDNSSNDIILNSGLFYMDMTFNIESNTFKRYSTVISGNDVDRFKPTYE